MEQCIANQHRVEYTEDAAGVTWYRCLDCGEAYPVYQENHGC